MPAPSFSPDSPTTIAEASGVFVYLRDVERIGYDAIVVLLSIMIRYKAKKIKFAGDFPNDVRANAILKNSGFFEALYEEEFVEQDRYVVHGTSAIRTHADKEVDPELTASLITSAGKTVWGSECRSQGIQRRAAGADVEHKQSRVFAWTRREALVANRKPCS